MTYKDRLSFNFHTPTKIVGDATSVHGVQETLTGTCRRHHASSRP